MRSTGVLTRSTGVLTRLLSFLAQFITFAGFVVIVAGLAKLQKTTNSLHLDKPDTDPVLKAAYVTTFSDALLTPYPNNSTFQFSFIWFIIFFQFVMLLFTLLLSFVPGFLHAGRLAALALLATALTLTINVVNNLVYLHRNAAANQVYGKTDINVTLAGALLVVLGNGFTILALGCVPLEASAPAAVTYGHSDMRDDKHESVPAARV